MSSAFAIKLLSISSFLPYFTIHTGFFLAFILIFNFLNNQEKTWPDTRPISTHWRMGRGSVGQGGGCNVAGQEQYCSEIIISVDFASSQILRRSV